MTIGYRPRSLCPQGKFATEPGHVILTANVDGNFNKRGLPAPLVLTFLFFDHERQNCPAYFLRNRSGT